MKTFNPRRQGRPVPTSQVRKARALRPALEACEARTLMSGATTRFAFEPLQFSATTVSPKGLPVDLAGTLRLTEGPKGGLAGTLVEADGQALKVQGTLNGQRIDLSLRGPSGPAIHAFGPVVSATTAASQPTLHGGGLILGAGNHSQGTFTLQGSDVVLPEEHLQNSKDVARVIPAGTTLMPTEFVGKVTHGPDAGMTVSGVLSLGKVGGDGSIAGSLADPVRGTVPVVGRIVGGRMQLAFDLGAGGKVGGVGPFVAEKVGKGEARITSFGSLQTANPADSGDWSVTFTPTYVNFSVAGESINATTGAFSVKVLCPTINFVGNVHFTLGGTAQVGVDYANVKGGDRGNADTIVFLGAQPITYITGKLIHHSGGAARTLIFTLIKPSIYVDIPRGVNTLTITE